MSASFKCSCGKKLHVKAEHVGKQVRCRACGNVFVVPPASASDFDVFISYSQADRETAEAIRVALETTRVRCWIAPRNILPGKQWGAAIIDGITQCRVMVLVFSGHSNQSSQVVREVERAVSKSLIIIPFRIADQPMSKALEYYLSSPHWLDALTEPLAPHLKTLTHTVQTLLADRESNVEQTLAARAAFEGKTGSEFRPQTARPHALVRLNQRPAMIVAAFIGVAVASIAFILWINRAKPESHTPEPAIPLTTEMSELPLAENLLVVTPVIYDPDSGTSSTTQSSLIESSPHDLPGPKSNLTIESRIPPSANPNSTLIPSRRPPQSLAGILYVDAVVSKYLDTLFVDLRFANRSEAPQLISIVHVVAKHADTIKLLDEQVHAEKLVVFEKYDVDVSDLRVGSKIAMPVSQVIPSKGTDRFLVRMHGRPKEPPDLAPNSTSLSPDGKSRGLHHRYVLKMTLDVEIITTAGTILIEDLAASFDPDAIQLIPHSDPYYRELLGIAEERRVEAK